MDQIGPKMDQKGLKIALLYQKYSFLHNFFGGTYAFGGNNSEGSQAGGNPHN